MTDDHELQVSLIIPDEEHSNGPILTPVSSSDILLDAITNPAICSEEDLKNQFEQAKEEDFTKEYQHENIKGNILTIACEVPSISDNVFRILFQYTTTHYGHLDFTEKGWYYWEPIHFAAYRTNVDKLGIIVDALGESDKLNVLTILSENALHVLLDYGRCTKSFNVQLSNGWESRICHVIAKEQDEVVKCAELLINAGIDINHNNIWNETPIIIAIRYRLLGVIEKLLKRSNIDLDSCKDSATGKSARDLLRQNEISLHLPTPNTVTVLPAKTLFTFLKKRDEEMFLRYNNENIKPYVNEMDGDNKNNTGGTMLQLCLIKGYIDYEKEAALIQEPQETDILKTPMLKFFCQSGFARSIQHLLNNDADIARRTRIFGNQNVFQMAVKLNYYPFLVMLLEHKSNQINQTHIMDVLRNTNEMSFESKNCNVLFLLTSKLEMLYQASNPEDNSINYNSRIVLSNILNFYLKFNSVKDEYRDNICQVLRLGASLSSEIHGDDGKTTEHSLSKISYDCLRSHLDECISSDNNVCYDSLIRDEENYYSETDTLHFLVHDSQKGDLLIHPALVYFIHAKWLKTSRFFYSNLALFGVFLFVMYAYMVMLQIDIVNTPLRVIFVTLLVILALKELLQFVLYSPRYFYDISNYLEISNIACCFVNVVKKDEVTMVIAILLSTVIFLLILGQVPDWTKYMIIFSSTKYFLEYAAFYFIQFISFALCFFILLPEKTDAPKETEIYIVLGQILTKLFDALIFFIGQYDGNVTKPQIVPFFSRMVVAVFIFCMTIILNNLLVGLIVTDMDVIQKTAKRQRQYKMIKYIARLEMFLSKADKVFSFMNFRHNFDTNVFQSEKRKILKNITERAKVFDEDDKKYLKEIHANRLQPRNVLNSLYEYIISDIYSDQRGMRDRDIFYKLSMLEEKILTRGRAR